MPSLTRKRTRPLDSTSARAVIDQVEELLDVHLRPGAIDKLSAADQQELAAICRRGTAEHLSPHEEELQREQSKANRQAAERAVAQLERFEPGDSLGPLRGIAKHNAALLSEFTREQKRPPSRAQVEAIFANRDEEAALASIDIPARDAAPVLKYREELSAKDRKRLEELVGLALAGRATYFADKREERESMRTIHEMAASIAEASPTRRRYYNEPGAVTLPAAAIANVSVKQTDEYIPGDLWLGDLAVLAFVAGIFEARSVPIPSWRLEENYGVLIVVGGASWEQLDPRKEVNVAQALKRLHNADWLVVGFNPGDPRTRETTIRKGAKILAAEKKRPE